MTALRNLIHILQALILTGGGVRAVYCICRIITEADQAELYKRRLKNLLAFLVISISILQLLDLIYSEYLT